MAIVTSYLDLQKQAEVTDATRVANTIHFSVIPSLHNYISSDNAELKQQLQLLKTMQAQVFKQEQEVYKLFGVTSIEALNDKIQNEMAPLFALNNRNLQAKLKLVDESVGVGHYLKVLQPLVQKTLDGLAKDALSDEEILSNLKLEVIKTANEILQLDKNVVHKFQHTSKNRSLGGLLNNFILENGRLKLVETINNSKFRPDVKSRLDAWIDGEKQKGSLDSSQLSLSIKGNYSDNSATSEFLITEKNRESYAGWAYSYKNIKDNRDLVDRLKQEILNKCHELIGETNTKCIQAFDKAFYAFPESELFANTVKEVIGNLGEIQLGAIVEMLTNGSPQGIQTGALRNELEKEENNSSSFGQKKKLSIDFVLQGVGFQVKNYNEYANMLGLDELQGKRTLTLGDAGLVSKVNEDLSLNTELDQMIQLFFGIQAFNKKYQNPTEEYQDTVENYDAVEHMISVLGGEIKNLYSLFPDRILRLSQDIEVLNQGPAILRGRYFKTFYFSNGVFIPASKLLGAIIALFDDLSRGNVKEFILQSSYSGPVAEDYLDTPNSAPTYESIVSKVHLRLSYVFLLDNYLNQTAS